MFKVGIDLGGTDIKCGILDDDNSIIICDTKPTLANNGSTYVVNRIADFIEELIKKANLKLEDCCCIGMGSPGMVDSDNGIVLFAGNLGFDNVDVKSLMQKRFKDILFVLQNDANVAALGEVKFGAGKGCTDCVLITLGTGVGGGVVIDGKIVSGNMGAGAELGHMVIAKNGNPCTCGRMGCLESHASATALIRLTKEFLEKNKSSKMWDNITDINDEKITSKLPFDYFEVDDTAKKIISTYLEDLSIGIVNFCNIFRPQAIILGGGISKQGDKIIDLLKPLVKKSIFGGDKGPDVKLLIAKLKNDAGFMGAACLCEKGAIL